MNALAESEMKSFMSSVPAQYKSVIINWYRRVVNRITSRVRGKYGLDFSTAEDVAVASATYSLAYFIQKNDFPKSVEDWMALAQKKANFLALDCWSLSQKRPQLQIDEPQRMGDEDVLTESSAIAKWSYDVWRATRQDEESRSRGAAVRAVLSKVIEKMGTKDRERTEAIFNAFYFEGLPMAEVGHRYGVTTNNGYQIVFKVKDAYTVFGRSLVEHQLEHVEMAA